MVETETASIYVLCSTTSGLLMEVDGSAVRYGCGQDVRIDATGWPCSTSAPYSRPRLYSLIRLVAVVVSSSDVEVQNGKNERDVERYINVPETCSRTQPNCKYRYRV